MSGKIRAVVFDLDGVLVDSEQVWDAARRQLTEDRGGRWSESATQDMMGMSSTEWSHYMHRELGVKMSPEEISAVIVKRMEDLYRERLPIIPGAREAVERVAVRWPLGLASSANRPVIEVVLELSGLGDFFETTVSSEEVGRSKPAPDVYLEAAAASGAHALYGGRGFQQRPPLRSRRRDARCGHTQPYVPSLRSGPQGRRRCGSLSAGAAPRGHRLRSLNRSTAKPPPVLRSGSKISPT